MIWIQKQIRLQARPRGFHLVTGEILSEIPELRSLSTGMLQVFLQHTSASLTLNENASPDVRRDFESYFNRAVPENEPYFEHTLEGPDDMPAHLKSSLMGVSILLPIQQGQPALGTWQGIYLCEHRDHGGSRLVCLTAWGEGDA